MLFGARETERLPPEAYSAAATEKVYASLAQKARRIIATGHSAIVDGVFARESERAGIEHIAKSCGVAFRGLFLTADLKTRIARVGARTGDASDADVTVIRQQEAYELGALTWTQLDASGTPAETLHHARAALGR